MGRQKRQLLKHLLPALIIISLSLHPALALNPETPIQQYLVDHWTVSDGLPSNLIHSISQTPDGYLWIATNKGLVRFDGIVFKKLEFAPQVEKQSGQTAVPEALYFDNSQTLWIGSSVGLTAYNFKTRRFKTLTTANGLTGDRIRRITKDINGNLWIGFVSAYLNRFDHKKFHIFNESHGLGGNIINALIEDRKGSLLIGTRNNGIFIHNAGHFNPFPVNGLNGYIINLLEDHTGSLWISTNKGLLKKNTSSVQTFTTAQGLSNNHTSDILEDSRQNLWIGTVEGLNRMKKNSEDAHRVEFEHILKPYVIVSLFEDREGNLWAGTYKSGLFRLKDNRFITMNPSQVSDGTILLSMTQKRDKEILIGTTDGILLRIRDGVYLSPVTIPGLSGTGITAIVEATDNSLILGTNGQGVIHLQHNQVARFTTRQGLTGDLITTIFKDGRQRLWIGTFDGISMLPFPNGSIQTLTSGNGLSGKKVHAVFQDKQDRIWIATDKGVTLLEKGTIPPPGNKSTSPLPHYLDGIPVTWIYEDPFPPAEDTQVFWFATLGAGLKRLSLENQTIVSYTTHIGMTTNFTYRFFEDRRRNFWLMSDSGILRIGKSNLNRYATNLTGRIDCTSFGTSEGLKNPEFNNPFPGHSAFETREGELWFMNRKEIVIINPEKISINKTPPPVVIEAVIIAHHTLPLRYNVNTASNTIHKFKDINALQIRFTAPTLVSSEKVTFQYKLEGYNDDWIFIPSGEKREARFVNLEPGTYTFRVIAGNAEGIWNTTGASLSFRLERSFSKTLLFKILLLLLTGMLGAAAVYGFHIARNKKKNAEKVKYKSSSMHPDFIRECVKKLNRLMAEEHLYRNDNISLPVLAQKLSLTSHQLSQILNDEIKLKFFDYINAHRIEEAKRIMTDPKGKDMKIQTIAFDVGFKTMTAFYKAFKKITGMTPSQYKTRM